VKDKNIKKTALILVGKVFEKDLKLKIFKRSILYSNDKSC